MPWVRFDDSTPDNPRIDALSDGAFRLWFNSICYSNRNLTDGFVPTARVPRLTPHYKARHMNELIESGRWHKEADGVRIHGYLEHQPSAAQVSEQREYERQKKQRQRERGTQAVDRGGDGRFMSRGDNRGDRHRDTPRDTDRESPATQPNPTSIDNSSSSPPLLAIRSEEEEEESFIAEARRRLADVEARLGPRANPDAWLETCIARLRDEHWQAPAQATPRPDCDRCESTGWLLDDAGQALPCPDCRKDHAA